MTGNLLKHLDFVNYLVFPARCVFCGDVLDRSGFDSATLCNTCSGKLYSSPSDICGFCGNLYPDKRLMTSTGCPCCQDENVKLGGLISVGEYRNTPGLMTILLGLKHGAKTHYAKGLGRILGAKIKEELPDHIWHGVTATPLHVIRFWKRSFNQAALIASSVSDVLKVPYYDWLLLRKKRTMPQSGGVQDRKENVMGAFQCCGKCEGANILLVDDVFTTGATTRECAFELMNAGAASVTVATIAWVARQT